MGFKDLLKNPYADLVDKPLKIPPHGKERTPELKKTIIHKNSDQSDKKPLPDLPEKEKSQDEKKPDLNELSTTPNSLRFSFFVKMMVLMLKDIKLLMRSKTSSLIIIFGPLLLIFLIGMAFNTSSLYDLKIATYSEAYSDLSNSIIKHLHDEQYSTFEAETLEDCIEGVKLGKFHACAIFSPNMAIGNKAKNNIMIHVDESRMNLAHMIEYAIQQRVSSETAKISKGLTGNIVTTMFNTRDVIKEKRFLITRLSSKTSDSILKISGLYDDLSAIDLVYDKTAINYTRLRRSIEGVKDEINKSAACLAEIPLDDPVFEEVDQSLNYLKTGVEALVSKFDGVIQTRDSSVKELEELKSLLKDGTLDLEELKKTLDALVAGVEGVEVTDVESIVSPVTTNVISVTAQKTHLGYQFPTFIILIFMFMSLLLSVTVTVREKLSKAFFRNFIMPTSDFIFMLSGYFTNMLIIALQIGVLFIPAVYFLPDLKEVILPMVVVLFLVTTVFVLIGMFIGFIFKSEETATLGAISIGSLMLFFSNTILPIETLPIGIRDIARFNPFVLSVSVLKKIMLFGANFTNMFDSISLEVYMLFCFVVIFFVLAFVAREVTKSRLR